MRWERQGGEARIVGQIANFSEFMWDGVEVRRFAQVEPLLQGESNIGRGVRGCDACTELMADGLHGCIAAAYDVIPWELSGLCSKAVAGRCDRLKYGCTGGDVQL